MCPVCCPEKPWRSDPAAAAPAGRKQVNDPWCLGGDWEGDRVCPGRQPCQEHSSYPTRFWNLASFCWCQHLFPDYVHFLVSPSLHSPLPASPGTGSAAFPVRGLLVPVVKHRSRPDTTQCPAPGPEAEPWLPVLCYLPAASCCRDALLFVCGHWVASWEGAWRVFLSSPGAGRVVERMQLVSPDSSLQNNNSG